MSEQSQRGEEHREKRQLSWFSVVWMVAAAVFYAPLGQYLAHANIILQPIAHAALGVLIVGLCCGVVYALERVGADRSAVTYGVMLFAIIFWNGGGLIDRLGVVRGVATGLLIGAVVLLILWRLRGLPAIHGVFFAVAVFLTAGPWASVVLDGDATIGDPRELVTTSVPYSGNGFRPDIYVVVLDAYPGIQTLARYAGWDDSTIGELEDRGFNVAPAWSGYAMTALSLPGLFDASFPVESIDGVQSASGAAKKLITTGEAAIFGFLGEADYDMTMLEPTFGEYSCGPAIHLCVESPFLDDLLFHSLKQSFIGPILERQVGSAWIHGAFQSVGWLEDNARGIDENARQDFVFAHLIVPHPPFLLNESCHLDYRSEFDEIAVDLMGDPPGVLEAHLAQVACVDRMILRIADAVPTDAIILFTADHGSALSGQFASAPANWSVPAIRERLSTFFAMRGPEDCQPRDPILVQNLLRGLMRCLGSDELPDLEPRMFLSNVSFDDADRSLLHEVPSSVVSEILDDGPSS